MSGPRRHIGWTLKDLVPVAIVHRWRRRSAPVLTDRADRQSG
jgi:hypothetical protein